ncbi:hypothetical protein [Limnobacter sp.]|uniref:hypothetical protein n=1 Tax=Limnobacter sp. TaxID=2003368 RepID=UPI0025C2FEE8|nr:hypothetical protein [Limnobacter sp.]
MTNETFTTHITFTSGDTLREEPIAADKLGSTIMRLCEGPAAAMGIIKEVKIVDGNDLICVHIKGRNIVYPLPLSRRQYKARKAQTTNATLENQLTKLAQNQA